MIVQLFRRRMFSDSLYPQLVQGAVLLIAFSIFVGGVLRIAKLELTEAQMLLGFGIVFGLVLQCGILWVLVELTRKLTGKAT